jgi:hypothetical protein
MFLHSLLFVGHLLGGFMQKHLLSSSLDISDGKIMFRISQYMSYREAKKEHTSRIGIIVRNAANVIF